MVAIVWEAASRAEEMGGFVVKWQGKKRKAQRRSGRKGEEGEGQHVKAGSVLSECHVLRPGV